MRAWRTLWDLCWRPRPRSNLRSDTVYWRDLPLRAKNNLTPTSTSAHSRTPLTIAAIVSTLGGLLFGYDNIVISGAIGYLGQLFHLGEAGKGWAAGCALVGCIVGCAAAGTVADYLGKKKGLGLCALCFALSSIGILFAADLHQFVLWRLIGGVGIGAAAVIAPNYIAEIAPTRVRGRCVTLYQLGIVSGILAAVFVNMLIQRMGDEAWNVSTGWRWMFFAGVIPAILFGVMILPAVESPRWLMKMGRRDEAIAVLTKIDGPEAAARETVEIENALATEEGHISELFTTFRRPLLLGIMLAGSSLQFVAFALVGWFYHIHGSGVAVLILVMAFVAGHAFGNGVACWVIISEIYPTKVRGRGMSIAITALWVVGYLGNQLFPLMQKHLGSDGTFWCFSGGALLTIIFVAWLIPETKGRSLEEITKFWTEGKPATT